MKSGCKYLVLSENLIRVVVEQRTLFVLVDI